MEAVQFQRRHADVAGTGLLILVASVAAGCGGASHDERPRTRAACPPEPGTALARATGVARAAASAADRSVDLTTCRYAAGATRVRVDVDTAPQAAFRWTRAQVERWQTAAGWSNTPSQQPRNVEHVGTGAFWVSATRELVATDRRRIVTVRVVRDPGDKRPRAVAVSVARAVLRTASF